MCEFEDVSVGVVIRFWAFVERHGLGTWVQMYGVPDPMLMDAMGVMERGIARWEKRLRAKRSEKK